MWFTCLVLAVHSPRPRSAEEFLKLKRKQKSVWFILQCVWSLDVVLFWEWCCSLTPNMKISCKKIVKQHDGNAVHFDYVAAHLPFSLRSTLLHKRKLKKRQQKQKLVWENLRPTKKNHAVHLSVSWSAVFSPKEVRISVWCNTHDDFWSRKNRVSAFC